VNKVPLSAKEEFPEQSHGDPQAYSKGIVEGALLSNTADLHAEERVPGRASSPVTGLHREHATAYASSRRSSGDLTVSTNPNLAQ
jgi:hypothetical protein